jgi:hypothetical protein
MRTLIPGLTLLLVTSAGVCAQVPQESQDVSMRFGALTVNGEKELLYKGRSLRPQIVGNNSLDLGEPISIGATDVVLVTDNGGTACPYMFYFVTISSSGAKATRPFGTCGEFVSMKHTGNSISLTMQGFQGPFEPEAEQVKAARQRHVFLYRGGVVTENGRPIK